jgi:hypothetical protein
VLDNVQFYLDDEEHRINVVASVSTPEILTPTQVRIMQDKLTQNIGKPTELIVHCVLSSNVSARGSVKNTIEQNLDGRFVKSSGNDILKDIATTEQVIREYFATDNAMKCSRVEYVPYGQHKLMLAHVVGLRQMAAEEIVQLQADIRKATGNTAYALIISQLEPTLHTQFGMFRYGWYLGTKGTPENFEHVRQISADLMAYIDQDGTYKLANVNVTRLDDKFHFLLEIVGPEVYPRQELEKLQTQLTRKFSEPILLYAWSRIEVVHGPEGSLSMKELNQYFCKRQKENLPEVIPFILETSRR